MSDKPRECKEHEYQCYKCGHTRAEPEPDWTTPLKRHVPEIKMESCAGCDTDDYDIHTCGKSTRRAEPEPQEAWCPDCNKKHSGYIDKAIELVKLGDEHRRGQKALGLLRESDHPVAAAINQLGECNNALALMNWRDKARALLKDGE